LVRDHPGQPAERLDRREVLGTLEDAEEVGVDHEGHGSVTSLRIRARPSEIECRASAASIRRARASAGGASKPDTSRPSSSCASSSAASSENSKPRWNRCQVIASNPTPYSWRQD